MAPKQLRNNQCDACEKTHEECADGNSCSKADISMHVCMMFGTRPKPKRVTRRK
jgi:hypothetical protein